MTKILLYDIETSPLIGFTWKTWDTNIIQVKDDFQILCWSAKWLDGKMMSGSMQGKKSDKECVKELWKLFDEADVIIGHNSNKFDNKKVTARFIYHKLPPPSPYKTVDTLLEVRKVAAFTSNKLDDLGEVLGEGRKLKTDFSLWLGCMNNDPASFKKMQDYNKQDVLLLEKLYLRLLPYMKSHPNMGMYDNEVECPKCGSKHLQSRGYAINKSTKYRRMQCLDCGSWCRENINLQTVKVNQII